jgi:hypothetical protein
VPFPVIGQCPGGRGGVRWYAALEVNIRLKERGCTRHGGKTFDCEAVVYVVGGVFMEYAGDGVGI